MAQISVGLLLVIVIRSLGEVLRLHHALGHRLPAAQASPYVIGALAAAVAALAVVTLHCLHSDKCGIVVTVTTVVALLTYKVTALG
jgi:hypothetical protein